MFEKSKYLLQTFLKISIFVDIGFSIPHSLVCKGGLGSEAFDVTFHTMLLKQPQNLCFFASLNFVKNCPIHKKLFLDIIPAA